MRNFLNHLPTSFLHPYFIQITIWICPWLSLFLVTLPTYRINLNKKGLPCRCFLENLKELSTTATLQNICNQLLLNDLVENVREWRHSTVFIVNYSTPFSSVSIVEFEQKNVNWPMLSHGTLCGNSKHHTSSFQPTHLLRLRKVNFHPFFVIRDKQV